MISQAYSVGTTATKIIDSDECWRTVYLHVIGNGTVYLGGNTVTVATGLPTEKHAIPIVLEVPARETVYAIVAADTEDVRVLRPSA